VSTIDILGIVYQVSIGFQLTLVTSLWRSRVKSSILHHFSAAPPHLPAVYPAIISKDFRWYDSTGAHRGGTRHQKGAFGLYTTALKM